MKVKLCMKVKFDTTIVLFKQHFCYNNKTNSLWAYIMIETIVIDNVGQWRMERGTRNNWRERLSARQHVLILRCLFGMQ